MGEVVTEEKAQKGDEKTPKETSWPYRHDADGGFDVSFVDVLYSYRRIQQTQDNDDYHARKGSQCTGTKD